MSKKAGYKPDYTYHNEDEYYVNDGILDEDPGDTEYTDWCHQCGKQSLGYIDPSSHVFYCNPCWTAFSSPQKPSQTQAQPQPQSQAQAQTQSNKKKSRRGKKNKNKPQQSPNTKNPKPKTQKTQQNTNATANRLSLFDTVQSTKPKPKPKSKSKSETKTQKKSEISNNSFSNRPSLFGNTDTTPTKSETKTVEPFIDDTDNYETETKIEPNPYIPEPKKVSKNQKTKKTSNPKSDKGIIHRQFIGHRIESQQTHKRHKLQKAQLIKERFGIDESKEDIDLSVDHDKDGDKKAKKKRNKNKHRSEKKPHINLVVIGHVDAGKSTLMGRLLYEYGIVTNKAMHKFKSQSAEKGKSSFAYAWVLDCHEEERKRGITVDVSTHYFETEHRCITLLDSPGHKDFIPNMISGASQADAAILVINSKKGDFETGFDLNHGQTREHAMIAKSLGVQQVIVAVNKMDCCGWSKDRFDMIVQQIKHFLREIGFVNKGKSGKKRNVVFIPVSGLTGGNLINDELRHDKASANDEYDQIKHKWWRKLQKNDSYLTNVSLFETIDRLRPSSTILNDSLHGKLRMSITDIYKESNVGIMATGKIMSGSIMNFEQILIQPLNLVTKTKSLISIESHSHKYKHSIAIKGDNIQLLLDLKDSNDEIFDQIKVGDIITTPHEPLKLINRFQCKIVTMKNLSIPICKGHHIIVHTQSIEKEAYIHRIEHLLNKKSGQIEASQKRIRHIKADECAIVTVRLKNKNDVILLDTYQSLKELGRITLRRDGQTIALGLVETI